VRDVDLDYFVGKKTKFRYETNLSLKKKYDPATSTNEFVYLENRLSLFIESFLLIGHSFGVTNIGEREKCFVLFADVDL